MLRSVILVVMLMSVLKSAGQDYGWKDEGRTFYATVNGGLCLAQVDGDAYFGYYKPGFTIGASVTGKLGKHVGVSMELGITQKGSRGLAYVDLPHTGPYVAKCNIGLTYVEVPVLVQLHTEWFGLEAGVAYGRLIRTNEWIVSDRPVLIDKDANRFEEDAFDCVLGLRRALNSRWEANVRFQYSLIPLRPLTRVPVGYSYGNSGQYSNLFLLRLAYILG